MAVPSWAVAGHAVTGDDAEEIISSSVVQVFDTGDGTWTKPDGAQKVIIVATGGGGAAGGAVAAAANASVGGGGGSGTTAVVAFDADDLPATLTVTRGAAGTGVSGANGNAGSATTIVNGGTTYVSCPGGGAGTILASGTTVAVAVQGGGGAAPTVHASGTLESWGSSPGQPGLRASGTAALSGIGGSDSFSGRAGSCRNTAGTGATGTGNGNGGGGAVSYSASSYAGGDGCVGRATFITYC